MKQLPPVSELLPRLQDWVDRGLLRALDLALVRFIAEQEPAADSPLLLAVALLSERHGHGHVCLDLNACLQPPLPGLAPTDAVHTELARLLAGLSLDAWVESIRTSNAVMHCWAGTPATADNTPLVLAGTAQRPLLYLRRYWQYEQRIRQAIGQRLQPLAQPQPDRLRTLLDILFVPADSSHLHPDWQKVACAIAARSGFALITGGPGTGKTTTVVRLLALLQGAQQQSGQPLLRIRLAAPTGKAAARLKTAITRQLAGLPALAGISNWPDVLPGEVTTLHRLLGSQPNTRQFRHHAGNPLPADLVVVDEASMVDVEMMACLLDALHPDCRLVLLGDKDQLASVEAGSILGDLCQQADTPGYTRTTLAAIASATGIELPATYHNAEGSPLQQVTCMLRYSHRFAAYPGIGALAQLVNRQPPAGLQQLAQVFDQHAHLDYIPVHQENPLSAVQQLLVAGYRSYLQLLQPDHQPQASLQQDRQAWTDWALQLFAQHSQFQLLTAVREGKSGVTELNRLIRQWLQQEGLLPAGHEQWYAGRPVLMTRNDYSLGLMNGDMGICVALPDDSAAGNTRLWVAFADARQGIRWLLPSRLQAAETVFAMTVHKSQGSEFQHTALLLPEQASPVLTRELLYTAITRSSQHFTLICPQPEVLRATLKQAVERASGLQDW